jgi:hypothetical protein
MINMSNSGMGFGGFLLGLGGGWYVFQYMDVSLNIISYILILIGAGIIINALLSQGRRRSPTRGLFGGMVGGLFLALFLTQGFTIIENISEGFGNINTSSYRAQDTRTLTGDVNLESIYLEIDNRNGEITLETWDQPGYRIDLTLRAKGATDAQARDNLNQLQVLFSDQEAADTLRLTLGFQASNNDWSNYAVSIAAKVPKSTGLDLNLYTSNGEIKLTDITGGEITLHTSNGRLTLDKVRADTLTGTTSNGRIIGEVEATTTNLSTSNGSIDITIPATISGSYTLDTSNGAVTITMPKTATVGYDIDLRTTLGSVDVDLPNLSYTTNEARRKVATTIGYQDKAVKVNLTAVTSIGSVQIN